MAYHHGDLRRALLTAALELLTEGGTAALTLRAAARRAGVSPAAPYRHFTDKRALLAAVAEEGFLALERTCVEAGGADTSDPVAAFARRGRAYVQFAARHPALYRLMFGSEIPDKRAYEGLVAASSAAYDGVRSALRAHGTLSDDEVEVRAVHAWALVHGLASLYIDRQLDDEAPLAEPDFVALAEQVLRLAAVPVEKKVPGLSRAPKRAL